MERILERIVHSPWTWIVGCVMVWPVMAVVMTVGYILLAHIAPEVWSPAAGIAADEWLRFALRPAPGLFAAEAGIRPVALVSWVVVIAHTLMQVVMAGAMAYIAARTYADWKRHKTHNY